MAKKVTLKRSLFIGLGGTGASALLHTKKRFLDTYGEIPPMIGFLSIDTDFNTETQNIERNNVLENHVDKLDFVSFSKSELLYISVRGAQQAYYRQKDSLFDWMPPQNEHVLRNMTNGAGQVRSNGRFALHFNYNQILNSVKTKINDLTNLNIPDNSRFSPKGSDIEINFVFSVSGGTGSGTFIDIAYLVKEAIGNANNATTIAFIVLPDVFNAMQAGPSMMNVRPNGYGALMDLDYLMRNDIEKLKLDITYQDKTIPINSNPFDVVFTVNNKNTNGETLSDIKEISEQIGLAMFTGASELSSKINSAYDNVLAVLAGGVLDIENKRAWAGGMGVSELFYDGNTLGNIYARKATASMITNLLTESNSAQNLANEFIDAPEILIRENNGNDYLIDALLQKEPNIQFPLIEDTEDLNNTINNYLSNLKETSQELIERNYKNKLNKVVLELQNKINEIINSESGVANTSSFLDNLKEQLDVFLGEMIDEEKEFKHSIINLKQQVQSNVEYLTQNKGLTSIFKKGEIKETKQELSDNINQIALIENEICRRQYAQKFFNALKSEVDKHKRNIEIIKSRLLAVKKEVSKRAAYLQNYVNDKRKTFVIDLHKSDLNTIYVDESDYVIDDFINSIDLGNKLYDFYGVNEDIIERYFWKYSKGLRKALSYVDKSIDDVIRNLSEEDKENIASQLISKSNALWNYDTKGYRVGTDIHSDFVIGLPSEESTFKKAFNKFINAQNISFVHTGVRNRIVCYRMECAVPIFAVNDVSGYEIDYKNSSICHHIDYKWLTKMQRENFSVWPEQKKDHSLEAWVMGLVYGFIKFDDDGKYKIQSKKKGIPRKDYWVDLSDYRDEAFEMFVKGDFVSETIDLIENKRKQLGEDATNELIKDVIENYYKKYSQINLSDEELDKKEFSKIAELIDKEIDFTDKELPKLL